MCGIFGYIGNSANFIDTKNATKMTQHRGPDHTAYYKDQKNNLYFGFNRLAFVDLSIKGNQPIISDCRNYVIMLNGEIYNHQYLREILKNKFKIKFKSKSDTEVLLYFYIFFGIEETLKQCDGMFAFSILDKKKNIIVIARDKFGEKPVYYWKNDENFIFSSELRPIISILKKIKIDISQLNFFLDYGFNVAPNTIIKNIFKLEHSHFIKYDLSKKDIILYKSYSNLLISRLNNNEFNYKGLEKIISKSVNDKFDKNQKVGVFLSSGTDSSLLALILKKMNFKFNTFSIGYENKKFDEKKEIKEFTNSQNIKNKVINLNKKKLLSNFKKLIKIIDEPLGDPSLLPTFIISKYLKSNGYKIALVGDGADEMFYGYTRYKYTKFIFKFWNFFNILKKINFLSFFLGKFNNKIDFINRIISKDQIYESFFNVNASFFLKNNYTKYEKKIFKIDGYKNIEKNMMKFDLNYYLPNNLTLKTDMAGMANSIEIRSPFLSQKVLQFANHYNRRNKKKFQQKKIIKDIIFKSFNLSKNFFLKKKGFGFPIIEILPEVISELKENIFSEEYIKKQNLFNFEKIEKLYFNKYILNENPRKIWNLIIFQHWYQNNLINFIKS